MATSQEYNQAFYAVRNGTANSHQRHLTDKAASQAGAMGNEARKAIEEAGKSGKFGKHWL